MIYFNIKQTITIVAISCVCLSSFGQKKDHKTVFQAQPGKTYYKSQLPKNTKNVRCSAERATPACVITTLSNKNFEVAYSDENLLFWSATSSFEKAATAVLTARNDHQDDNQEKLCEGIVYRSHDAKKNISTIYTGEKIFHKNLASHFQCETASSSYDLENTCTIESAGLTGAVIRIGQVIVDTSHWLSQNNIKVLSDKYSTLLRDLGLCEVEIIDNRDD